MSETFDPNEYWLKRGRNYVHEAFPAEYHRFQESFLIEILRASGVSFGRILELGCGFGRITRLVAESFPQAKIVALDLSPEQLQNAGRYCGHNPNISFRQYDFFSAAPLPEPGYDAALAIEVFLHHPRPAVRKLLDRLSPVSEHLINLDWSEPWPWKTEEHVWVHDYAALYAEVGLQCATFVLPEKVNGLQQKLFIAARELSQGLLDLEAAFKLRTAMPSSRPNIIPPVIHLLRQLRPQSILDVGVGFGKWGHLFREYTDIVAAELDPARYQKNNWRVRIDGIEGHAPYLTPMHHYLYDTIHVGDALSLIKTLANYDLIFLGDVLEHFEKPRGLELLRDAAAKAGKAVIVSTPKYETAQEDLCGNELERHRSLWSASDLRSAGASQIKTIDGDILLAVFLPSGSPRLEFRRGRQKNDVSRPHRTREAIRKLIPTDARLILVDEEQLRASLGMENVLPFLEKEGTYWGPPEDDGTAISELERMRKGGAQFVVFVWSTFWWLEHYQEFQRYLRSRYRCVQEDDNLVAFDLCFTSSSLVPE